MPRQSNNLSAQRTRILAALKAAAGKGITTLEARNDLDIMHPGGRIMELRQSGHRILTIWSWEETDSGKHRVARYILVAEPF